jgi:hypothetical protein
MITLNINEIIPLFNIEPHNSDLTYRGLYIYYDGHVFNQDISHHHNLYKYDINKKVLEITDISIKDLSDMFEFTVYDSFTDELLTSTIEKIIFQKI